MGFMAFCVLITRLSGYETIKSADENRIYQLTCPEEVKEYFKNYFADVRDREYFAVAYLDTKHQVIKTEK